MAVGGAGAGKPTVGGRGLGASAAACRAGRKARGGGAGLDPRQHRRAGSVGRLERWTGDLAAKDCHFVTQNDDPEGKPISVTAPKGHRLGDAGERTG